MPAEDVDLKRVAEQVGHSSRATCGTCHFKGGGGDAVKHADLSSRLIQPERDYDVHMGGYDFTCTECHRTINHRIAGRSSSVPVVEGLAGCEDCHTAEPHYKNKQFNQHLNKHCEHIACNTCHSPLYAKHSPTVTWWDWSKAGDKQRTPQLDRYGLPDYHWKKGEFQRKAFAKPHYAWHNGYMERIFVGDTVDKDAKVIKITSPVGSIRDPLSKIAPFKIMQGVQAVDAVNSYFLIPHLFPRSEDDRTAYWKNLDWQKAFSAGMDAAGLEYSGSYQWVHAWMYWRVEHEVLPASRALTCVQCHSSLREEKACYRCHQDIRDEDFDRIANEETDFSYVPEEQVDKNFQKEILEYIDFKKLGYKGDPIVHGGRFKKLPSPD